MADYGCSTGQGNAPDLHHLRQLPIPGGPLVACRICDAVFSSSQALINHIGAHVADDGAAAAASRRQNQRSQTYRFPPGSPFSAPPRVTPLFLPNRFSAPNSLGLDAESLWPNQLSPFARNLFREGPPYPPPIGHCLTNRSAAEEASGDCTKPYINQLEKCIPKVAAGAEEDDGRQLCFSKVDLTLKL